MTTAQRYHPNCNHITVRHGNAHVTWFSPTLGMRHPNYNEYVRGQGAMSLVEYLVVFQRVHTTLANRISDMHRATRL